MTYFIIYIIGVIVMAVLDVTAIKANGDSIKNMIPVIIVSCLASWATIIVVMVMFVVRLKK